MEVESPTLLTDKPSYRLAAIFHAHNDDVKQVYGTSTNNLITCSRDETMKIWGSAIYNSDATNLLVTYCPIPAAAVNSLAYVEYKNTLFYFAGRKDGSIVVYEGNEIRPLVILKAHTMNVCCLHVNKEYSFVVSGGWDHNAIIWSLDSIVNGRDSDYLKLVGHSNSVWAINSFNDIPDCILTGSADRTIKQWKGDQLVCTYSGHKDVVRSIICIENGNFYSACNDSKVRFYNRDSKHPIHTYETDSGEFIYSIHQFQFKFGDGIKRYLAASMETGVVEILSVQSDYSVKLATSLMIPNDTAWSVTTMPNNDIVIGAGDGNCYVFTWCDDRVANPAVMDAFFVSLENYMAMNAKNRQAQNVVTIKVALDDGAPSYNLKYEKGTDPNIAAEEFIQQNNLPASYLNEIVAYIKQNIPEAAQYDVNKAINQRLQVDSSTRDKSVVNGKSYDYVFDVKLDDGRPAKLPYNVGEDPMLAATRFVEMYNLPVSNVLKIANLLRLQIPQLAGFSSVGNADPLTGGSSYSLSTSTAATNVEGFHDPLTGGGRYVPGTTTEKMPIASLPLDRKRPRGLLVPLSQMIKFGDAASPKAIERLYTLNAAQEEPTKLSNEEICALEVLLSDPSAPVGQIHIDALDKGLKWSNDELIPILDALRIGLLNEKIARHFCNQRGRQTFEKLINILVSSSLPAVSILVLRCFANSAVLKISQKFLRNDITFIADVVLNQLQSDKPTVQFAAGAVLDNLSLILWNNTEVEKVAELGPREDALRSIIKAFENKFNLDILTEKTLVQLLQAVSTIMWGDSSVIRLAKDRNILPFINKIKDKVADESGKALSRDIVEMVYAV